LISIEGGSITDKIAEHLTLTFSLDNNTVRTNTIVKGDGRQMWTSGRSHRYGLGPYGIAAGILYVLNDQKGTLHLAEASPDGFREITRVQVLKGHDAWAPMAFVSGRLILRDLHDMVCLDIKGRGADE
jgi:hypothetical protein